MRFQDLSAMHAAAPIGRREVALCWQHTPGCCTAAWPGCCTAGVPAGAMQAPVTGCSRPDVEHRRCHCCRADAHKTAPASACCQPAPAPAARQHSLWPPASSPLPGMHSPLHQIQPEQRGRQSAGRGTQWRLQPAGGGHCSVALPHQSCPHQMSPRVWHHHPPGSLHFGPLAAPRALLLRRLHQGILPASGRSHPRLLPAASPLPARQVHFSAQQLQSSAGHVQRSAEQPFS